MLLAPPGAGKGTQATRLAEHFGVEHIAVGDLLRDHIRRDTELGRLAADHVERGELVPDMVVMDAVMPRVVEAARAGGFVLNGYGSTPNRPRRWCPTTRTGRPRSGSGWPSLC